MTTRTIYFIKPIGMDGPIKIGITFQVEKRFRELLKQSPFDLEILALHENAETRTEHRIHRMLVSTHRRHEWFEPSPELQALIDAVNAGTFDPAALPEDKRPLWYEHHAVQNRLVDRSRKA